MAMIEVEPRSRSFSNAPAADPHAVRDRRNAVKGG